MPLAITFSHATIPPSALASIISVFRSGQFSPGPFVRDFEESFAKAHAAKHAVFVNSGTDALRISLETQKELRGWVNGDRVAVPSLTFVATVNVILQAGLLPYFVDVGMSSFRINTENLAHRRLADNGVKLVAVMPVHLFGGRCDESIYDYAKDHDMVVIEDSCETILNPLRGAMGCHSTYMAHHLTTGVGGMILTNSTDAMLVARSFANHGRSIGYLPGYTDKTGAPSIHKLRQRFSFDRIGYSCRGTEFDAALGLSQMPELDIQVSRRRSVAIKLISGLAGTSFRTPLLEDGHTFMMFPVVSHKESRDAVCLRLEESGIETRPMMPITNQPCYRGMVNENEFSVAKEINRQGFYIPCHPAMSEQDINKIIRIILTK